MGIRIGQTPGTLAALRNAPEFGRVRLEGRRNAVAGGVRGQEGAAGANPREQEVTGTRVGFGEGTLSPQAAALRTIGRTVEEARRRQPSLDEIRERFQASAAERRRQNVEAAFQRNQEAARSARDGGDEAPQVERGIPAPNARARNFVSQANATNAANAPKGPEAVRADRIEARSETAAQRADNEPQPSREPAAAPAPNRPARFDVRV